MGLARRLAGNASQSGSEQVTFRPGLGPYPVERPFRLPFFTLNPFIQLDILTHAFPAIRRALSLAHFAFYCAYLQGPVAVDLPVLADLYLNSGKDPRKVRVLLRWLQDELGAAARRTGDREAVRLLRLPKSLGVAGAPVDVPSLESFVKPSMPTACTAKRNCVLYI